MTLTFRPYRHPVDYQRVYDFLIRHYQPLNQDGNWLAPVWEYMHGHPFLDPGAFDQIGLWEENGELVAAAHYESRLGEAFFQFHPVYRHLRQVLLDHAEQHLAGQPEGPGPRLVRVYVREDDDAFNQVVESRGYTREPERDRPLYHVLVPRPFPAIHLPPGFGLTSLAERGDWAQVHRVMWRGFNHPGEPPAGEAELDSRRTMFDTRTARRDLKIAVTAPSGDFVAFCGMFYTPAHRYAYVEPVATDPAFRKMGLGKAAVLEGIRRCAELGATLAYVGSDQAFYQALGFRKGLTHNCWVKAETEDGGRKTGQPEA